MSHSFTPGPWSVADHDQGDQDDGWRTVMARGRIVANVNPESFCGVEGGFVDMPADANARLIAAAPTMYEYIASSASNGCAEARKIMEAINAGR